VPAFFYRIVVWALSFPPHLGAFPVLLARQSQNTLLAEGNFVMKRLILGSAALAVLLSGALHAKAGTIMTFNESGTFEDGSSLSGTVTIDTTAGVPIAMNMTVGAPGSLVFDSSAAGYQIGALAFSDPISGGTDTDLFLQNVFSQSGNEYQIVLVLMLPVPSLQGYTGGALLGSSDTNYLFHSLYTYHEITPVLTVFEQSFLVSGSELDPASTVAPEPSTLVVWSLIAGIFGVGAMPKRLKRTSAA
jgi:hypothetical protein